MKVLTEENFTPKISSIKAQLIFDMESKLREYSGEIIGDINSRVQALSRDVIIFTEEIQTDVCFKLN